MTKVSVTTELPVSADTVWKTIGNFNAMARWHPAVARSEERQEKGATLRTLTLQGGGSIVERLEAKDDGRRSYSYSILDGPLPVKRYQAELSVREKGEGCTVEWSSEFEPAGAPESEAVKAIRGVYEAGFANLRKMFGAG
jgi:hypothetical protein